MVVRNVKVTPKFAFSGAVPGARIRATQIVFSPPSPFPVAFRVMGPGAPRVRQIAEQVRTVMLRNADLHQVNTDWGERVPTVHAVIEATVQRARPLILTALAAILAFIPLTFSVFWSSMAYTLIGGTIGGTILTLIFLPALYAMWFKIKDPGLDAAKAHGPEPLAT